MRITNLNPDTGIGATSWLNVTARGGGVAGTGLPGRQAAPASRKATRARVALSARGVSTSEPKSGAIPSAGHANTSVTPVPATSSSSRA